MHTTKSSRKSTAARIAASARRRGRDTNVIGTVVPEPKKRVCLTEEEKKIVAERGKREGKAKHRKQIKTKSSL